MGTCWNIDFSNMAETLNDPRGNTGLMIQKITRFFRIVLWKKLFHGIRIRHIQTADFRRLENRLLRIRPMPDIRMLDIRFLRNRSMLDIRTILADRKFPDNQCLADPDWTCSLRACWFVWASPTNDSTIWVQKSDFNISAAAMNKNIVWQVSTFQFELSCTVSTSDT